MGGEGALVAAAQLAPPGLLAAGTTHHTYEPTGRERQQAEGARQRAGVYEGCQRVRDFKGGRCREEARKANEMMCKFIVDRVNTTAVCSNALAVHSSAAPAKQGEGVCIYREHNSSSTGAKPIAHTPAASVMDGIAEKGVSGYEASRWWETEHARRAGRHSWQLHDATDMHDHLVMSRRHLRCLLPMHIISPCRASA